MPVVIDLPLNDVETTEEEIKLAQKILTYMKNHYPSLSGFGGECLYAAYALNQIIFENKANIVGICNQAIYEKTDKIIGHFVVHYLTDELGSDFLDLEDFKPADLIDSWGMLDSEDQDYIDLFEEYSIAQTEENFDNVVWLKFSMEDAEKMMDNQELLNSYIKAIQEAKEYVNQPKMKIK